MTTRITAKDVHRALLRANECGVPIELLYADKTDQRRHYHVRIGVNSSVFVGARETYNVITALIAVALYEQEINPIARRAIRSARHAFTGEDYYCSTCQLPESNGRHRHVG